MNKRFKLAEAMGWKSGRTDTVVVQGRPIAHTRWIDPDGNDRAHCPDPFTDANDCDALIKHLNSQGYEIDLLHWKEGDVTVILKSDFNLRHAEDTVSDWKQGVCELALKVIE